jgi:hypothetical protein
MVKLVLVKTTLYCACNIRSQQQRHSWITFDLNLRNSFIIIMCIIFKMNNITHVCNLFQKILFCVQLILQKIAFSKITMKFRKCTNILFKSPFLCIYVIDGIQIMYLVLKMGRRNYWQNIIIISLMIITMILFLVNNVLNYIRFTWLQESFGQTSILFGLITCNTIQIKVNMLHGMCTFHHTIFNYF